MEEDGEKYTNNNLRTQLSPGRQFWPFYFERLTPNFAPSLTSFNIPGHHDHLVQFWTKVDATMKRSMLMTEATADVDVG